MMRLKPINPAGLICMVLISSFLLIIGCKPDTPDVPETPKTKNVSVPVFDGEQAFSLVKKQLEFGVREPGTPGHKACKEWIRDYMKDLGAKVKIQEFEARRHDGKELTGYNIMAQINPEHRRRILLAAHWDTRYMAEKDSNPDMVNKPIPGADDGATGTAALMEIARVISENPIDLGVDFLFLDLEDQGSSAESAVNSWALGSQYWSRNRVPSNYAAEYGILLDMIGAKNAAFGREAYSVRFAKPIVDKIWDLAKKMGYSDLFHDFDAGPIADDHYYINTIARIPMIDIINRPLKTESGFGDYHHTHDDNLDAIDKRTLRVVGQVVTAALYRESTGNF